MCSGEGPVGAAESLALIRSGLSGLAAAEVDGDSAAELGGECVEILATAGCLQMEAVRRLARFQALGGPAADGAHSPAGWLGHHARLRPWEARRLAVMASRLHLLGKSVTAFEAGEVGFGDVATIAEGIDAAAETMTDDWPPERVVAVAEPILLELASKATPGQLRKAAARIGLTLDGQEAERRRRQIDRQAFADAGQTMDGVGILRAEMGATDLAIVEKAIDVFAPRPDPQAPRWANLAGHRRLRGLVGACRVALEEAGRCGYRERGGAPVKVHLIASATTVDPALDPVQAPPGRTEFNTLLTATEIRTMLAEHDAECATIRINPDGSVADRTTADGTQLNWGRTRRLFTAAQRDIFLALHAGCAAEGCDRPVAWSAIDHRTAWVDGGRTDLVNGQPLCDWHNLHKEHRRTKAAPGVPETSASAEGAGRGEPADAVGSLAPSADSPEDRSPPPGEPRPPGRGRRRRPGRSQAPKGRTGEPPPDESQMDGL